MIKKTVVILLALVGMTHIPVCAGQSRNFVTIKFPPLENLPEVRVFYCGHRIKCERHKTNNYITCAIPSNNQRFYFDIIITPTIGYTIRELNTIKYLTIPQEQAYKWYRILLVKKAIVENNKEQSAQSPYGWEIHKLFFGHGSDRRIPDDAIIICYNPDFVEDLKGGNAIDLPHIMIKSNVIDLVGSEQSFREEEIERQLALIDLNAFHSAIEQEHHYGPKTILAMNKSSLHL